MFFCAIAACSTNQLLSATFPGLSWAGTQTGTVLDEDAMMFLVRLFHVINLKFEAFVASQSSLDPRALNPIIISLFFCPIRSTSQRVLTPNPLSLR